MKGLNSKGGNSSHSIVSNTQHSHFHSTLMSLFSSDSFSQAGEGKGAASPVTGPGEH